MEMWRLVSCLSLSGRQSQAHMEGGDVGGAWSGIYIPQSPSTHITGLHFIPQALPEQAMTS